MAKKAPCPTEKLPPIKAIRRECVRCMGDEYTKEVRELIIDCVRTPTFRNPCPLWEYRLGKRPETPVLGPVKAMRAFCRECQTENVKVVRDCNGHQEDGYICTLVWYRMGKNPARAGIHGGFNPPLNRPETRKQGTITPGPVCRGGSAEDRGLEGK